MSKKLTLSKIKQYDSAFKSSSRSKISMNALTRSKLDDVTMNWDNYRLIDHNYSNVIKHEMSKTTNQKASGRCWGFAALNLMRISLSEKYKLQNF